ncbi:TIGR02285 family protein [Aeromonas dhakensis]|uniref:TIGR02285 family protein n=1 Tax=Aeromonas dhakensis TaxID=196024 RepID=UPI0021B1A22C|nr:TIGR02285 family protein [Aeromonas dhakensis]UXB12664.1 TIGR02285 family protein [Aeromonas dhakensis]
MKWTILILLSFIISVDVTAKETINWVQYDIPPFYIKDGSYSGRGIVDITDSMIREQLPQYNHVIIWANIARIRLMMEQGKNVVCGNMIKTPEREKYQIFSDTYKRTPTAPHVIIPSSVAKNYTQYIVDGDGVDLLKLIQSKDKFGYFIASRSYGSKFDNAIESKGNKKINYSLNSPMGNVLDMILKDENGFTVAYPEEITYYAETKYGYGSAITSEVNKRSYRAKFLIKPISGQANYILTYVAAPKTEWGYKVMRDINNALLKLQLDPNFMSEEHMWKEKLNAQ